jgi:hypothetical protein
MTDRPDRRTLRLPHQGAVAATTALCTRPAGDWDNVGPAHGSSRRFGANASPGSGATDSTTLRRIGATAGTSSTWRPDGPERGYQRARPAAASGAGR